MKPKKQLTGIDLLLDICNRPNKYARVMNVPSWQEAALALIELGHKLGANQRPRFMRTGSLYCDMAYTISKEANANWNLN